MVNLPTGVLRRRLLALSRFDNRKTVDVTQGVEEGQGKDIFFNAPTTRKKGRPKKANAKGYIRQTFHITDEYKKAIALMAAHEGIDKSEIVRKALEKYVPKKYLQMVVAPDVDK